MDCPDYSLLEKLYTLVSSKVLTITNSPTGPFVDREISGGEI